MARTTKKYGGEGWGWPLDGELALEPAYKGGSKNSRRKRGKRGGHTINSMTRMARNGFGMLSSSLPTFSQGTPKVEESQTVEEFIKQHNIPEWVVVDTRLNIYTPEYLKAEGFTLLNEHPKPGADDKLVCFVHPKDAGGVLMELTAPDPSK
jgi:hypothetical protein